MYSPICNLEKVFPMNLTLRMLCEPLELRVFRTCVPVRIVVPFISLLPSLKKCKQSFPARVSGLGAYVYYYRFS